MGGFVGRSSAQPDGMKMKVKTEKQKRRHQQLDTSFGSDIYFVDDINESNDPNSLLTDSYNSWDKAFDQQQMMNINDPPGAPHTYPVNYPNDIMTQSWASHHDLNKSFYQINSSAMINTPYDSNQYIHDQISNYQSQPAIFEEGLPKKVQFASSRRQQRTSAKKPLISTQSWHEPSVTTNDTFASTTKPIPLSSRPSNHRAVTTMSKTSASKPIYVGIDYEATLAERGQTVGNKGHHKNNPDEFNSNHRNRSHTHHHRKHQESMDSPASRARLRYDKSLDSPQTKSSNSQLLPISTNKLVQKSSFKNEIKPSTFRNNHQQESFVDNEIKPSKSRENHRRHRRHQHVPLVSNASPLPRRIENKQHSSTPVMRIRINQQQKQPIIQSAATVTTSFNRTRM